jgi:hypothetical protein
MWTPFKAIAKARYQRRKPPVPKKTVQPNPVKTALTPIREMWIGWVMDERYKDWTLQKPAALERELAEGHRIMLKELDRE